MVVLDASVWVAFYELDDPFHAPSVEALQEFVQRGELLYGPAIVTLEVGCAVARRLRSETAGRLAAARMMSAGSELQLVPLDSRLLELALTLGMRSRLRGADALYAATAALTGHSLLSWDGELIQRVGALTPTDWLLRQANGRQS